MKKLIFILHLLTSNIYAQQIITSSEPLNYTYLVYYSSLTAGNKNTIKNIVNNLSGRHYWQPAGRFFELYNSTSAVYFSSDFRLADMKGDATTTKMLVTLDADYDSTIQPWITSGKVKRVSCLWQYIYNLDGRTNLYGTSLQNIMSYPTTSDNADWNLYTVQVSTI
jgi:hypothetical protein